MPNVKRGFYHPTAIIILAVITLSFALVFFINTQYFLRKHQPSPTLVAQTTTTPSPSPQKSPTDATANWKTYNGKYFSFKYPQKWIIENALPESAKTHLEMVSIRGSSVVSFTVSAEKDDYQKVIDYAETLNNPKVQSVIIGSKTATQLSYKPGDVIAYPMTNVYIKTNGSVVSYYLIAYDLDNSQTTQEISQILSTFKFLD